ncbi:MAG: hypothetical protein AB7F89_18235 [Pirellulaceae bacterium]
MQRDFGDVPDVNHARQLVLAALRQPEELSSGVEAALHASLRILDAGVPSSPVPAPGAYAGSLDYTVDDENYPPHGRQWTIRVHYSWTDYDRADEPSPTWGATIEDIEVLEVRYYDAEGNEVPAARHQLEVVWELLKPQWERVTQACTEDGCRQGVGRVPAWFSRQASCGGDEEVPRIMTRMARSLPTRSAGRERRRFG